jgi:hypothetical protein
MAATMTVAVGVEGLSMLPASGRADVMWSLSDALTLVPTLVTNRGGQLLMKWGKS